MTDSLKKARPVAFPGGAKIKVRASDLEFLGVGKKKPKPCAYGPRTPEGKCPPKPRKATRSTATRKTSAKGKKPCKYGPRVDGKCPRKPSPFASEKSPRSSGNGTRRSSSTTRAKVKSPGETLKRELIKAGKAEGKKAVRQVQRDIKKQVAAAGGAATVSKKIAGKIVSGAGKVAGKAKGFGAAAGVLGFFAALYFGAKAHEKKRVKEMLLDTERNLKRPLTKPEATALAKQYLQHIRQTEQGRTPNPKTLR